MLKFDQKLRKNVENYVKIDLKYEKNSLSAIEIWVINRKEAEKVQKIGQNHEMMLKNW